MGLLTLTIVDTSAKAVRETPWSEHRTSTPDPTRVCRSMPSGSVGRRESSRVAWQSWLLKGGQVINDSGALGNLPPWVVVRVNDEVDKALADVSAMAVDAGDAKALLAERAQRCMEILLNDQEILEATRVVDLSLTPEQQKRMLPELKRRQAVYRSVGFPNAD